MDSSPMGEPVIEGFVMVSVGVQNSFDHIEHMFFSCHKVQPTIGG